MPDKPFTVLTYAASASLAAVALIYFFNPNFVIDGVNRNATKTKKTGIVGLVNTANDCFTNSSLQALAGLGDLRLFLIRELHRRKLGGADIYLRLPAEEDGKPINRRKLLGLQSGDVTQALKTILDQLNERPLRKKTISARPFILTLERAFETRISREQQDAQELLQIIAERVCDEYHAGRDARKRARKAIGRKSSPKIEAKRLGESSIDGSGHLLPSVQDKPSIEADEQETIDDETGFPMEGQTESQIVCSYCNFTPKSSPVSFVMLTLSVPQKTSATLNDCFDAHFKREVIEDYKCDKCRLEHAVVIYEKELRRASSSATQASIKRKIERLKLALETDPEKPPEDVLLPDSKTAPTRRIERHVKITRFPQILVIHLSRSIFHIRSSSAKNMAKVSFPEKLPLGGLIDRRNYKLSGMIAHKGTHNSGHYECFRRQHVYTPFSTPHVDPELGPYSSLHTPSANQSVSPLTPKPRPCTTPEQRPADEIAERASTATSSSQSVLSDRNSTNSTRASTASAGSEALSITSFNTKSTRRPSFNTTHEGSQVDHEISSDLAPPRPASEAQVSDKPKILVSSTGAKHKTRRLDDRWWRISDDKIRECKTSEVLDMQREVYILFYEMERS